MASGSVARRYARALMDLGVADGQFEAYSDELGRLEAAFAASAELRDVWLNPAHGKDRRLAAVAGLTGPLKLSASVGNLLRLLVERQRIVDLSNIARAYRELVDEKAGRVRATVTSAAPLSADLTAKLGAALAGMTKKRIVLDTKVDPSLIGGVTAQVGSTVLDGSLKTQLEQLRESLRGARS